MKKERIKMGELANCSRCNQVFVKSVRPICRNCFEEEEEAFKIVYRFLSKQKNRSATLVEIVEATEVEEELIVKFIKEKRLQTSQFPNLGYPCEQCKEPITSGRLCKNCSKELLTELDRQEQIEQRTKELQERERKRENEQIYFSINRNENK